MFVLLPNPEFRVCYSFHLFIVHGAHYQKCYMGNKSFSWLSFFIENHFTLDLTKMWSIKEN